MEADRGDGRRRRAVDDARLDAAGDDAAAPPPPPPSEVQPPAFVAPSAGTASCRFAEMRKLALTKQKMHALTHWIDGF